MFRIAGSRSIVSCRKIPKDILKLPQTSLQVRNYATGTKKKSGHPILYTLGFTTVTVGGVVAYAKFDHDFRLWLEDNLPGSDKFIELLTSEKGVSLTDVVVNKYESVKEDYESIKQDTLGTIENVTGFKFDSEPKPSATPPSSSPTSSSPPSTNITPLSYQAKPIVKESTTEQRTESTSVNKIEKVKADEKPKKSEPVLSKPSSPKTQSSTVDLKSFADLESKVNSAAKLALDSYQNGVQLFHKLDTKICEAIEDVSHNKTIWNEIKIFKQEVNDSIKKLEVNAVDALKSIEKIKDHISDPKFQATADQVNSLRQNINAVIANVQKAKFDFENQKTKNNITEKYWNKIKEEKEKYQEELHILFPDLSKIEETADAGLKNLNFLLLYAANKIEYYQKELINLEMKYVKNLQEKGTGENIDKLVEVEISKERRKLQEEYQKKLLELEASFEKDIVKELKHQAEAHSDHLKEVLNIKQSDINNKLKREYETQLLEEKTKLKQQMATLIGRMKGFEDAFKKRAHTEAAVQHSQALWGACQSLMLQIKNAVSLEDVKPLKSEIENIKKSAAKSDTFVETICSAFPSDALNKGVYSDQMLRERFLNVQDSAYRVALVPEDGGSLPLIFLSYLQSMFIIRGIAAISPEEIRNEPTNVDKLNTYEILERARYFVDRSDFLQAVKYMNLLKGGSRAVSQSWINDTVVFLETEAAAKALLSHAASVSSVF